MKKIIIALFALLLIMPLACAARFELNSTYVPRSDLHPQGVFVDGSYIYIWYNDDRLVYKYYIEPTGKFRTSKSFGAVGPGVDDYMSNVVSAWVDGDYLYVLDKGSKVFKFDKNTGEFKFKGDSESYALQYPAAIAASKDTIYMLDRDKGQVNVLSEYSPNKYVFKSSISWNYLGIGDAIFKYPEGLFVYNDTIYIADTENNRIAVFTNEENYSQSYGRGSSGSTLSNPHFVAVDADYIYVVQNEKTSIEVLLKSDGRVVYSIDNSTYKFKQISGIFPSGDQLYVTDYKNQSLIILYLNKSSLLGEGDVVSLFAETSKKVDAVCSLYTVASDIKINTIDRCPTYRTALAAAFAQLNDSKYDVAYSTLKGIGPQLEGDASFLGPQVKANLQNRSTALAANTQALSANLSGSLQYAANKIFLELTSVNNNIDSGNYADANVMLKELEIRYASLSHVQDSEEGVENQRIDNYKSQLTDAQQTYAQIRSELDYYKVPYTADRIEFLLNTTGEDIDNYELDTAYTKLTELVSKLSDAQSLLNAKKGAFISANSSIAQAQALFTELNNSKKLSADTARASALIANATSVLYDDPVLAEQYADEAVKELNAQKKIAEDANFLTMLSAAAVIFGAIILALIIFGLKQVFKKKKPWEK